VSKVEHPAFWQSGYSFAMSEGIRIKKVEKDGDDGLVIMFSDGTITGYIVKETRELRPNRERAEEPVASKYPFFLRHGRAKPVSTF